MNRNKNIFCIIRNNPDYGFWKCGWNQKYISYRRSCGYLLLSFSCFLHCIFDGFLRIGKMPLLYPLENRKNRPNYPNSYRSIALTSISCKLMEKIVLSRLTYFLNQNNLLPSEQYGFRRGTMDRVLYFAQKIRDAQNFKPSNHTVAAFLGFSKASTEYGKINLFANFT